MKISQKLKMPTNSATKTPSPHSHFIAANLVHGGLFTSQKGMKQKNEDG